MVTRKVAVSGGKGSHCKMVQLRIHDICGHEAQGVVVSLVQISIFLIDQMQFIDEVFSG